MPEMSSKCSRSGEGKHIRTHTHTHIYTFFTEFLRLMKPSHRKLGKYYQFYFRTQKSLLKSSVYRLMHIHKVIHLLGTYSHPDAVKKLQL